MTAIGICVEWIASFIEVTLCNYFMYNLAEVQFTRKKQRGMFFAVMIIQEQTDTKTCINVMLCILTEPLFR